MRCCGSWPPTPRSPTCPALHARAGPRPPPPRAPGASSPSACARPRPRPATATSRPARRWPSAPGVARRRPLRREAGRAPPRRDFVAGGRHLWNSGMFVATAAHAARRTREPMRRRCWPRARGRAGTAPPRDLDFLRLGADAFAAAPSISIDYAVMERTAHAAVVPAIHRLVRCRLLGRAVGARRRKDAAGNVGRRPGRDASTAAAATCAPRASSPRVVGLEDVVVVVTDDAVLVAPRDRAQDVKKLVDRLKARRPPGGDASTAASTAPGAATRG